MSNLTRAMMMGAAGAAGGATYVDDVFSTYLYDGTGSAQTITNGIDISGEGGLVWLKQRDVRTRSHALIDTARGISKYLSSDLDEGEFTASDFITSFNNNGFSLGAASNINQSGAAFASWTFRKAPGFFDVVTYTGNQYVPQTISHNLGSVPGCIIVKCTSTAGTNWRVYHRSGGATVGYQLDSTDGSVTSSGFWNNIAPTSTEFTVGSIGDVNGTTSQTYVAYLFAHDDAQFGTDEDESIIKCGSFSGNGSYTGPTINLGFEPQWLMVKRVDANEPENAAFHSWIIQDNMRGLNAPPYTSATGYNNLLFANQTVSEGYRGDGVNAAQTTSQFLITPTGFTVQSSQVEFNRSTGTYIYMAIRRPHNPPEAATEVFDDVTYSGTGSARSVANSLSYTDLVWLKRRTSTDRFALTDRLRGGTKYLRSNGTDIEETWSGEALEFDQMDSFGIAGHSSGINNSPGEPYISWNFKRAPGFMDVVTYTGASSDPANVSHNLGVVPELIIVKQRDRAGSWVVYHSALGATKLLYLESTSAAATTSLGWADTAPTASVFTVGSVGWDTNYTGQQHIAYLFATLPGISKVGSYTGTGNAINVDCGFTAGARFVLIKRTDSTDDWYVWDTVRGIVSGNDPYLLLNSTAAEVTNTDYIDPLSSGFTVTSSAPTGLNASGGSYIFLAIA